MMALEEGSGQTGMTALRDNGGIWNASPKDRIDYDQTFPFNIILPSHLRLTFP
jgi:hypothetical protein